MQNKNIAIVGGGSTGPVLLIFIAKIASEKKVDLTGYTFHLIDPKGFGNGGLAYGEAHAKHILNTLRTEMSPWDKNKFRDFVISSGKSDNSYSYETRIDFLKFLKIEFANSKSVIKSLGGAIKEYKKKALVHKSLENKFDIIDENKQLINSSLSNLSSENIILTVGYGPNTTFDELKHALKDLYFPNIYDYEIFNKSKIFKNKKLSIGVVGSAASLYDFVLALSSKPKSTKLYIFSTVGDKEQDVRRVEKEHLIKWLDLNKLKAIDSNATIKDLESAISYEFDYAKKIKAGHKTWVAFSIMLSIGSVLSKVNESVAIEFRNSEFFKKLKRLGGPTSKQAAKALKEFRPEFIKAYIKPEDIKLLENHQIEISANNRKYIVDCLVNVSGQGRHNSDILENMKSNGLAQINKNLDILATDESRYRLKGSGIVCIGPATHFGVDGIESFAGYIERFVQEFLANL